MDSNIDTIQYIKSSSQIIKRATGRFSKNKFSQLGLKEKRVTKYVALMKAWKHQE